jgi:acyl carrier protein phosphodiesterase
MYPYMQSQNWLYNYQFTEGILNSFAGLARRAAYMPSSSMAGEILESHYKGLQACYTAFFPALKDFAHNYLQQLLNGPDSFNFVG